MKSLIEYLCIFIFAAIVSIILLRLTENSSHAPAITQVVRDTIYSIRESKPIILTKCKTKTVRVSDTVFSSPAFTATVDTVVVHDTIRAEFAFPQNLLSLEVRKAPDTSIIDRQVITREVEKHDPWWRIPLYFLSGTAIGYVLHGVK